MLKQLQEELAAAIEQLGSTSETFAWDLIRAVMESTANTAITPVQDLLGLGTEARMNLPGRPAGKRLDQQSGMHRISRTGDGGDLAD